MSSTIGTEAIIDELAVLKRNLEVVLELQKTIRAIILGVEEPEKDELEAIRSDGGLVDEEELFGVLENSRFRKAM